MKLFSTYRFDCTKSVCRETESVFQLIEDFLFRHSVPYENFFFRFSKYYTKQIDTDFFQKYCDFGRFTETAKELAPGLSVNECTLSNYSDDWIPIKGENISADMMGVMLEEAFKNDQIWVQLIWNKIRWFHAPHTPLRSGDFIISNRLYPMNDNICLHRNYYDKKIEVYATFEYEECHSDIDVKQYVCSLSDVFQLSNFENYVWQIETEKEKEECQEKRAYILGKIKAFEQKQRGTPKESTRADGGRLSLPTALKSFVRTSQEKWGYFNRNKTAGIVRNDVFHNRTEVCFEENGGEILGFVTYTGAYFEYSVVFSPAAVLSQKDIKNYIGNVVATLGDLDNEVFSEIRGLYPATPVNFLIR